MSFKKYKVISETYWDGVQLHRKGETVEVDTDVVFVAWDSRVLQPIGDSPVFETKVTNKETGEFEKVASQKRPKAARAPEAPKPPVVHHEPVLPVQAAPAKPLTPQPR